MERFSIGRVLGTSLRLFMNNIVPFMAVAALVYAPALIFRVRMPHLNWSLYSIGIGFVVDSLLAAIVTYGVLMELQGTRASYKDCVLTGLRQLPRVVGVTVLSAIAICIGFVLLVVPGLIVAASVYVAVPVALVERPGAMASIHRSRDLVLGHKGAILVILLVLWLGRTALERWFGAMFPVGVVPYAAFAASAIVGVFAAIATAVGYTMLRCEREGMKVPDLATAMLVKSQRKTA